MLTLYRASFRQLLLIGFLLIAGVLAATALGGLFTLDRLSAQSREAAERAGRLNATLQQLSERSVAMERSARQFLVLEDRALRQRFDEAAADAEKLLQQLQDQPLNAQQAQAWRELMGTIRTRLDQSAPARRRDQSLTGLFRELENLTQEIGDAVHRHTEARSLALQQQLEDGRVRLGRQVAGAIGLAALLSLAFGFWLTRPLRRLERAIEGLGENRFDRPVEIEGPSDLRSLGQRLDWLRLRLGELDADKARFLRHVSHELKTPLAALREGVALLEDGVAGALTPDQREIARILRDNTAELQRQIEDLLRFNAAAFEARRLQRRPTELAALIRGLIEAQRLQWQARQLHIELDGGPVLAEVDPDKLGTACANLLSNAIRFSPVGGGIRLHLAQQDGQVRIDIRDEGPGVAPADRARVFEPFYRGERQPADALRGTGVGLSIVQEYIAAHGGQIELLPTEPGAHFQIRLPHVSA
ncbi:HAMP domain-containing protein [Roseateles sp. DAIF2]|uniref:ATP-binding protein n=1 Tax=Roseateles sp. DAIF2 TaxID=2714952 RepID=UPI0018A32285|nr:ATP-binding protein [Roseateles sp. DAIF2]QPF75800.1 HAMP domain-containing protein [Roseateles sp. DAIF2]